MTRVLSRRELNRALLARQHLLERVSMPALDLMEHLAGMQAQAPRAPYVALWSRSAGFRAAELEALIEARTAVRAAGMLRTTIHLLSAADALAMRPVLQRGVVERGFRSGSPFARNLVGLRIDEVIAVGRQLLMERPRSTAEMGRLLGERWPDRDAVSLAMAVRYLVPLVQVPPRGLWSRSAPPKFAILEDWLGRPLAIDTAPDSLVLRYLAAFGPATVADVATWSWLTDLRPVLERLRPGLRVFHDEHGRELFDVPEGLLPDPESPAPPRLLPEFDNVLLLHKDRAHHGARAQSTLARRRRWPNGHVPRRRVHRRYVAAHTNRGPRDAGDPAVGAGRSRRPINGRYRSTQPARVAGPSRPSRYPLRARRLTPVDGEEASSGSAPRWRRDQAVGGLYAFRAIAAFSTIAACSSWS